MFDGLFSFNRPVANIIYLCICLYMAFLFVFVLFGGENDLIYLVTSPVDFLTKESFRLFSRIIYFIFVFFILYRYVPQIIKAFGNSITLFRALQRGDVTAEESISSAERQVAVRADVLSRDFESKIKKEVDLAVARLATKADTIIKGELSARIDAQIGDELVTILGDKLATQTVEGSKILSLRQDATDRFVQMRSRALEYAATSQRQSASFRRIGMILSIIGLLVLGISFTMTIYQYFLHPELLDKHFDLVDFSTSSLDLYVRRSM